MVAARDRTGGVEGPVLPGAVGIGRAQDFFRTFQLLGHLNEPDRLTAASIETAPVGLSRRDSTLGELIGFVHKTGVSDPEGPVPVVRHAVVTEAVYMVDLEPVVARTEEEVARQLPAEVSAFSELLK